MHLDHLSQQDEVLRYGHIGNGDLGEFTRTAIFLYLCFNLYEVLM